MVDFKGKGYLLCGGLLLALFFTPINSVGLGGKEDVSVFLKEQVVRSNHFVVHHEDLLVPAGVLNTLEGLQAKLLLDLGTFSPWAYRESIHVYLYKDGASYSARTGMPAYVGAHINVIEKKIYGYVGPHFQRTFAHELGHLYFMQYFIAKSTVPPLWLNEGVATLMEWEYGLEGDHGSMDRQLAALGPIPFDKFFVYSYAHAGPNDGQRVGQWYNQAQSVTRFLMRGFTPAQFVKFCDSTREGQPMNDALRTAYGLVLPDVSTFERLWKNKNNFK